MNIMKETVMFIPAAGWGERVADRGVKPFLVVPDRGQPTMALDRVMAMAPDGMDIEIALRREMGCPVLSRPATVHFMNPTSGQARTVYEWLKRSKIRQFVIISNCDNAISQDSLLEGIDLVSKGRASGIVFTFRPKAKNDDRWSYLEKSRRGIIDRVVEKNAISEHAVAGVYLLNMFALRMALLETDVYLSSALTRMPSLFALEATGYVGWNTIEQLQELEAGIRQVY